MNTRQPTIAEAVEIMTKTLTDRQRRENIGYWREKYGDEFADRIEAEAKRKGK